jgi:pimeloyl-ACP methyl ester carboxylesterase
MPSAPRVIYATRGDAPVKVHVRPQEIPIIVVPGIMGSRLTDPRTDELVWNPMGSPLSSSVGGSAGVFMVDPDRIAQVAAPLVPDETHRYSLATEHRHIAHIKHFYNIIPEFYGDLAKHLASLQLPALQERHLTPKVYCCGYDWRQDNARSAARLAAVVDEALRDTGARKVIIVAHSMGGLVARYYSRVLGGEAKIHQLILLASPNLGAPGAYAQLRRGLYGIYFKDLIKSGAKEDWDVFVEESVESGMQIATGISTITSQGGKAVFGALGDLLLAMSLGRGKFFTREESRYFARQLPSIYQLMPSGVFCHQNRHWIIFDPAATGHRPTGFMTQLPTVLDFPSALLGPTPATLSGGTERAVAQLSEALNKAAKAGESAEVSGRALRNSMTVDEWATAIAEHYTQGELGEVVALVTEMVSHAGRTFVDGRSNRALYTDIYTGLLDVPSLRALTATNLELAFAFDSAMTVDDQAREPVSFVSPVKALFKYLGKLIGDAVVSAEELTAKVEMRNLIQEEIDANPPKVYMHPRTTNIYGKDVPGDGGAIVIPRGFLSRDDSNLVKVLYLQRPYPIGLPLCLGDGTVPEASGNPPNELLSNPFVGTPVGLSHKGHNVVPADRLAFDAIDRAISEQIEHFPKG